MGENATDYAPITKFMCTSRKRNGGKDYTLYLHPVPVPNRPYLEIQFKRLNGPGKECVVVVFKYTDDANGITEAFSAKLEFDTDEYTTIDINMLSEDINLVYGDDDGDGEIESTVDTTSSTWGTNEFQRKGDDGTFSGITKGNDVYVNDVDTVKTLHDVTQHYMRLMALYFDDGPVYYAYGTENGNDNGKPHYDGEASNFLLQYLSKQDLKYLYVTQGNLDVALKSTG